MATVVTNRNSIDLLQRAIPSSGREFEAGSGNAGAARVGRQMTYSLENRLVVGVASSALFDLSESQRVFSENGLIAYRKFQEANIAEPLSGGVAFPFVRRLLGLNALVPDESDPLVEVIVLSRNSPETGSRVMRSIRHHELPITRAIFTQGRTPWRYLPSLNMALFLTAEREAVTVAVEQGHPAGWVVGGHMIDEHEDQELRIAFDFDGVLADDAAERIFQAEGLDRFQESEALNAHSPHQPGPLKKLLSEICRIQAIELARREQDPNFVPCLRTSIITARSAPAHERAIRTLAHWGVAVDDAFFLGGIDKSLITQVLRPHIYFDDQKSHLETTARSTPSVHIPFGIRNTGA